MLRPIDVTMTIQHAADAQRVGSGDPNSQRPELMQRAFADKLDEEVRRDQQRAGEVNEAEKNEVNPDRKGDGSGYRRNRRAPKKKALTKPDQKQAFGSESMYDIRI